MFPLAIIAHQLKPELFVCISTQWMLPNAFRTFLVLSSHTMKPVQRYSVVTQLFPRTA